MVNRMFTYRPRDLSSVQAGVDSQEEKTAVLPAVVEQEVVEEAEGLVAETAQQTSTAETEGAVKESASDTVVNKP
jgi:hypothetical protein